MKKRLLCFLLVIATLILSSCTTVIPNSTEAKAKLEALGYSVDLVVEEGENSEVYGKITQITTLSAIKDRNFLCVYFFANEEDTNTFYQDHIYSINSDAEVVRKNKYSIYKGSRQAVEDFLS